MDPVLSQAEPAAANPPEREPAANPAPPTPPGLVGSGAAGAVIAVLLAGLLIAGLCAVARDAPSSMTDPRLLPTTTAAPGSGPFRDQVFVTVVPEPAARSQPAAASGADGS